MKALREYYFYSYIATYCSYLHRTCHYFHSYNPRKFINFENIRYQAISDNAAQNYGFVIRKIFNAKSSNS